MTASVRRLYVMPERKVLQMTERKNRRNKETKGLHNSKTRDSSSKLIFEDPILCAQFLRNYVDIPILKDVQPEDIEDVTERYVHMFVEERNSDVVKKVHRKGEDTPFYLISLIEHKSDVDYNVVMQVFRYMVFIWEDYEREMEKIHPGISRAKEFRYPPVLPIVFYDGISEWTAALKLHDRVFYSDILGEYIPDYRCILVQLNDYTDAELMDKRDELSIIMLIDKLKNYVDYRALGTEMTGEYIAKVTEKSPEYLLTLLSQVITAFLAKLNVPYEEAEAFTEQIKERRMGELFSHFEGWDVQAIRKEAREEARKEVREELREEARKEVREEVREEAREQGIKVLIEAFKEAGNSKEVTRQQLVKQYSLEEDLADEKMKLYWKE